MVIIKGLNKGAVLAALYNHTHAQGMGLLHFQPEDMTPEQGEQLMKSSRDGYFDYVKGRVMKVDLSKDEFDPWLYDRDNFQGAAQAAVDSILE